MVKQMIRADEPGKLTITGGEGDVLGSALAATRMSRLSPPPRSFALRIALYTAVAVVLAQLGALGHLYAHDAPPRAAAELSLPAGHATCADCLGFAPLLFAAGALAALPAVPGIGHGPSTPLRGRPAPRSFRHLAFRSRAPPGIG